MGPNSSITILDGGLDFDHIISGDGPAGFYGDCYYTVTGTCYWTGTTHGVLAASVIASRDDDDGYIGIAQPTSGNFASIKVVANNLSVSYGSAVAGLDWAISSGYSRHIVNVSFGWCESSSLVTQAVQSAASAGILMVAAAGDAYTTCGGGGPVFVMFPARYDEVIGVTGTAEDDAFWAGPQYPCGTVGSMGGGGADLSAPFYAYGMVGNGDYYFMCGTSVSAAFVTGVAALVWSKNPTWTAAQVKQHLFMSVKDLGPAGWDEQFGYGRIDAAEAVGYGPPAPALSVTISGTTEIPSGQWCAWYAGAIGGTAPYSYAWRLNGQPAGDDSPEFTYENSGSPFTLAVTVTDAVGTFVSDDHSVTINPNAGCL